MEGIPLGPYAELVELMRNTPAEKPQPMLAHKILKGEVDLVLNYTGSEDGRLHGEKYYQTFREEYRTTRPAFRWRQVVALARVTSSAYCYNRDDKHGFRAAGYEDACRLLGVDG